jgi:hypothetical protein
MKIKSDTKTNSIFKKIINNYNISSMVKSLGFKIVLGSIMGFISYEMWFYSGLIALFILIFYIIIIFEGNPSPTVGKKLAFTFIAIVLIGLVGVNNIYKSETKIIPVEFSKIKYTDSTEKTIIFMTDPIKKAVVVEFGSSNYYMMKEADQNISIHIVERGFYNHWDKLLNNGSIEEYTYDLVIVSSDQNFTKSDWFKKKNGDRQFIK